MFNRKFEKNLLDWKDKTNRKPLIIRGARQTGKTTLIRKFSKNFKSFIELNLEKDAIQRIFSETTDVKDVIQSIEGITGQRIVPGETLLFLDEIQNSIVAIKMLRYFYEESPDLHVISAGSLLEVRMKKEGWSFPVGRVEFLYLYPVTFDEFLMVTGEGMIVESIKKCGLDKPLPVPLHDKLSDLLSQYMVVGGMPEAVNEYITTGNFLSVRACHEALTSTFKEDFAKYAKGAEAEYLKLLWDKVPFEIGTRISYSKIGGSSAASREISKAFNILHEAMLIEQILPTVQTSPPLVRKLKAAPKVMFLDVGLCTHTLGLTKDQIKEKIIDPRYTGALFEEFVAQEVLAMDAHNRNPLYFWIREKKGTSSELDLLIQKDSRLIPLEVKSGGSGSLKSLHQFLYRSSSNLGVRIYNGPLKLEDHTISLPDGKPLQYKLLSIPFYLLCRLYDVIKKESA